MKRGHENKKFHFLFSCPRFSHNSMEYNITYLILAALFGIALPIYSMLYAGKQAKKILLEHPEYRTMVYIQSAIFQWVLVAVIIFTMWYYNDGLHHIGFDFVYQPHWVFGLFSITLLALLVVNQISISDTRFKKLKKRY